MACGNHPSSKDMQKARQSRQNRIPRDYMPKNKDTGSIKGFQVGWHHGRGRPGEFGKIMWDVNPVTGEKVPGSISTHVHTHPGGVTISTFYYQFNEAKAEWEVGRVDRYNFSTGGYGSWDPDKGYSSWDPEKDK